MAEKKDEHWDRDKKFDELTPEEVERATEMYTLMGELSLNFLKFSLWPGVRQMVYLDEMRKIETILKDVYKREATIHQTRELGN